MQNITIHKTILQKYKDRAEPMKDSERQTIGEINEYIKEY